MAGRVNWGHFHLKGECFSIWSSQSRAGNPRSAGRRSRPLPGGRGRRSTSCGRCPGGSTAAGSLRCSWRMGLFLQNPNTCSITAACFLCCSRQPLHKLHSAIDRGGKERGRNGARGGNEGLNHLPFSLPLLKTVTSFRFTPRPLLMVRGSLVSVLKARRIEPLECALKKQPAALEHCVWKFHVTD